MAQLADFLKLSPEEQASTARLQRYFSMENSQFYKEYEEIMAQKLPKPVEDQKLIDLYTKLGDEIDISINEYERKHPNKINHKRRNKPRLSRGGRRKTHRRKSHRRKTHRRS